MNLIKILEISPVLMLDIYSLSISWVIRCKICKLFVSPNLRFVILITKMYVEAWEFDQYTIWSTNIPWIRRVPVSDTCRVWHRRIITLTYVIFFRLLAVSACQCSCPYPCFIITILVFNTTCLKYWNLLWSFRWNANLWFVLCTEMLSTVRS